MHYLVTGHTGFKGAWLVLLLKQHGHTVSGLALDPVDGALFTTAGIADDLVQDARVDIRDAVATRDAITSIAPDVVIHLAAQPLVRESYKQPRLTFETNVMGTLNVLEAVAATPSVKADVMITTDKVYRNVGQEAGYVEHDPLGGHDPYSSSKAMADLLIQSWVASFDGPPTAVARAGNVIGGGDVSRDRLLPDLLASFARGEVASIRLPKAVRPWQHVLDCLNGYSVLAESLLAGGGLGEWNFGPGRDSFVSVGDLADRAAALYGGSAAWSHVDGEHPHEAHLLALDAAKAQTNLDWHNRLDFAHAVEWTVEWQKAVEAGESPRAVTLRQIEAFGELP